MQPCSRLALGIEPGLQALDVACGPGLLAKAFAPRVKELVRLRDRRCQHTEPEIAQALDGPEVIYLSVDIDVIDPGMAPGTGTPEPGGMLTRELLRAVRQVVSSVELAGMDVVEVPAQTVLTGTVDDAERAGLVNRVVPAAELEDVALAIAGGEHEGVHDRFRTARLAGLGQPRPLIAVHRIDVSPRSHARSHVRLHKPFVGGHVALGEQCAKRGTRQRVWRRRVARNAFRVVIPCGVRPFQPPLEDRPETGHATGRVERAGDSGVDLLESRECPVGSA